MSYSPRIIRQYRRSGENIHDFILHKIKPFDRSPHAKYELRGYSSTCRAHLNNDSKHNCLPQAWHFVVLYQMFARAMDSLSGFQYFTIVGYISTIDWPCLVLLLTYTTSQDTILSFLPSYCTFFGGSSVFYRGRIKFSWSLDPFSSVAKTMNHNLYLHFVSIERYDFLPKKIKCNLIIRARTRIRTCLEWFMNSL